MIQDWHEEPRQLIDNVEGGITREIFTIALFSGNFPSVFGFTPSHMIRIKEWISYHVAMYEKEYGPIEHKSWFPSQESPFMDFLTPRPPLNPPEK